MGLHDASSSPTGGGLTQAQRQMPGDGRRAVKVDSLVSSVS